MLTMSVLRLLLLLVLLSSQDTAKGSLLSDFIDKNERPELIHIYEGLDYFPYLNLPNAAADIDYYLGVQKKLRVNTSAFGLSLGHSAAYFDKTASLHTKYANTESPVFDSFDIAYNFHSFT